MSLRLHQTRNKIDTRIQTPLWRQGGERAGEDVVVDAQRNYGRPAGAESDEEGLDPYEEDELDEDVEENGEDDSDVEDGADEVNGGDSSDSSDDDMALEDTVATLFIGIRQHRSYRGPQASRALPCSRERR